MLETKRGRIANLTSEPILLGTRFNLYYRASRAAIAAATFSLVKEPCGDGITLNAIVPGMPVTKSIRNNQA